jgi:cyclase
MIFSEPGLHEVEDRVFVRIGPNSTSNAGFVIGDDAIAVIDTFTTPAMARELAEDVRRVTSKPIRYVLNTHYHGDHTFGNQVFPDAVVMGHQQCREELEAKGEAMQSRFAQASPEAAASLAEVRIRLQEVTFNQRLNLYLGGRVLHVSYHGPAHTRGDAIVVVPDAAVAFAGDLLTVGVIPGMQDADFPGWIHVLDELQGLTADTLVPGHGAVGTKEDLRIIRDYLGDLWGQAAEMYARGQSAEDALASIKLERYAGWARQWLQAGGIRRAFHQLQERHRHRL